MSYSSTYILHRDNCELLVYILHRDNCELLVYIYILHRDNCELLVYILHRDNCGLLVYILHQDYYELLTYIYSEITYGICWGLRHNKCLTNITSTVQHLVSQNIQIYIINNVRCFFTYYFWELLFPSEH